MRQDFERGLNADLAKCLAFVQLLGPMAGKRPPDVPRGFGWLQLELARRTNLPILQWRSPDLDVMKVEAPVQKELLEQQTVRAVPFEDFKRTIVEGVQAPSLPPTLPSSMLFINADSVDKANADVIKDSLGGRFGWSMPLSLYDADATPEELQQDMEHNLINSEGMVVLYGAVRAAWVTGQLQLYRKLAPRRQKSLRLLAVVELPPAPKPRLPIGLPDLKMVGIDRIADEINRAMS